MHFLDREKNSGKNQKFIKKIINLRSGDDLKTLFSEYKDKIKFFSFPVIIALAVLFFWIYGGESKIEITNEGTAVTGQNQNIENQKNENPSETSPNEAVQDRSNEMIYVDIGGEVNKPGVYELKRNTRLFQLIELAGGLTEDADNLSINQASIVEDGQKIIIRSFEETQNNIQYPISEYNDSPLSDSKININSADSMELQNIPGIGPSKAQSILSYREENGPFKKIEDIKKVSGIGERTFENIKDYISV